MLMNSGVISFLTEIARFASEGQITLQEAFNSVGQLTN